MSAEPPLSCESDLCVIMPERSLDAAEVLIGECKDRDGGIDINDVENLRRVADRLRTRQLETFIVFAKLGSFSDAEVALAKSLNGPWQHRVILLTDQELEPYEIYGRHRDGAEGRLYGGSLSALAQASEKPFAGLRSDPMVLGASDMDLLEVACATRVHIAVAGHPLDLGRP